MDFTPSLSAFQGVILSTNNAHSFSKLTARGGNEKKVNYVIETIQNFLQKENYVIANKIPKDSVDIMRKFAFYVVINSDLTVLDDMLDLEGIDYAIWTVPTIPKYLMCEILWGLCMQEFIYEIVVFSYPQLALDVASALIENFKYFNPTECLQNLKLLTSATYRLICRLIYFKLDNELTNAFNNFQNCLKYFLEPPNIAKLQRLSKDEQYKFTGKRLYMMLCLLSDCFNNYSSNQNLKPADFHELYELTYRADILSEMQTPITISNCDNKTLIECINNCNEVLLDTCKILVMDVNVEIFCAWSEFEDNDISMQQSIGAICYKVYCTLSQIPTVSDHAVVNMIKQISCKPLEYAQEINNIDSEVIVENINKMDSESSQWVRALIHREKLCEDQILMDVISNHLESFTEDECYKLFKIFYNHIQNSTDNLDKELVLIIKVFQQCNDSSKQEILEEHFNSDIFTNILQTQDFNNMMTEIFNKLIISSSLELSNVFTVFIQNPREVLKKIFTLASENVQQTDIMIKVMNMLDKFSKHYYNEETEPCIILITKETIAQNLDTDDKQNNFVKFLSSMKTSNVISGPKLLLLIIMPNLHKALIDKNIDSIYINCKILEKLYPINDLLVYRAPTLAMLAQVLDVVRWKLNTFVALSPATLEMVLKLQTSLLNTYEINIPEKESTWLKNKLRNINPLNMYYFRRLWNPPGNTFVEVISGIHIHKNMDMEQLTLWLSQVITSTILEEWYQIWDSLSVFGDERILDLFHDALLLISIAEKSNPTQTSKACLLYCIKNFVAIVRYKFLKPMVTDDQILMVFNKFILFENLARDTNIEELSAIVLPLFAFILSIKDDLSNELKENLVNKFKHKFFIDMIQNLFNQTKSQVN